MVQMKAKLHVDLKAREVRLGGREIHLAPKEFDVLAILWQAKGNCVPAAELANPNGLRMDGTAWSMSLFQHVCRLRRKLGRQMIVTSPKRGFKLPKENHV